ncbi:hypothetical protein Tco_0892897 [Tanacetum coccineum]|uniref:Uncharacterized protein n=1 Tax=Tanacetum coccineum TaxID=301880 RepID=A0ABQ5C785_9ASTR
MCCDDAYRVTPRDSALAGCDTHHGIDLWLQVQIFYDHVRPATRRAIDHSGGKLCDKSAKESWELTEDLALNDNEKAHLAPKPSVKVNNISSSCEICGGPHDTQCCMENPEQAFVDYASSRRDEARGKWFTFKPEKNTLGDTYNPSWKSQPNLRLVPLYFVIFDFEPLSLSFDFGFTAALAVLVIGASQSRQHGKSESDSYYLSD